MTGQNNLQEHDPRSDSTTAKERVKGRKLGTSRIVGSEQTPLTYEMVGDKQHFSNPEPTVSNQVLGSFASNLGETLDCSTYEASPFGLHPCSRSKQHWVSSGSKEIDLTTEPTRKQSTFKLKPTSVARFSA